MASNPTGKETLRASLRLFRQDPHLVVLPLLGAVAALLTMVVVATPIIVGLGTSASALAVACFVAGLFASSAAMFFNVGLVFAATERIEGRTPTVGGSLAMAWGRRRVIVKWALVSTIVGTLVRALERRVGLLGRLVGVAGAFAWAAATFFVLPVLAFEDRGPVDALRRSSGLLKERFGTVTRGGLRFGLLFGAWLFAAIAVVVVGAMVVPASHLLGGALVVVGVFGVLAVSLYAGAAGIYLRTILYRFATDRSVPELGVRLETVLGSAPVPVFS